MAETNIVKKVHEVRTQIIPYTKEDVAKKIRHPNCKLCNTDYRAEAENFYERTPNMKAVFRWIQDTHNYDGSYPAMRNHLLMHYKATQKYEYIEGYADDIKKWMTIDTDRVSSLKMRRAVLERELLFLGADAEDMKSDEKRKNIELMKKIADTLLNYDDKLDQIQKRIEPVTLILTQLNIILTDVMKSKNTVETKEAFEEVLNKLEYSMDDILNAEV